MIGHLETLLWCIMGIVVEIESLMPIRSFSGISSDGTFKKSDPAELGENKS